MLVHFLFLLLTAAVYAQKVTLDIGDVVGVKRATTWEFLGIKFATAGKFKAPQDQKDTPFPGGSYDASKLGPCCSQTLKNNPISIPPSVGIADGMTCLNLNIFTPADAKPTDKRPVMVWIFGGGAMFGCINQDTPLIYNGSNIINNAPSNFRPIIVAINYRLNAYGKLYLDYLKDEDATAAGSYQYLDMLSGLRWINKHIEKFGGDPNRVTTFGESAGGDFASGITAAKGSQGLVHRFIAESTVIGLVAGWTDPKTGNEEGMALVRKVGCDKGNGKDTLACLRALDPNVLPDAMGDTQIRAVFTGSVYDGPPSAVFYNNPPKINAIIGFNLPDNFPLCQPARGLLKKQDLSFPITDTLRESVLETARKMTPWGYDASTIEEAIKAYGLTTCDTVQRCCLAYEHMADDAVFGCNARRVLIGLGKKNNNKGYLYKFECHGACPMGSKPAQDIECQHTSEIAYVWGTESAYAHNGAACSFNKNMRDFSTAVIRRWTEFAATGEVTGWQPITCGNEQYLNITQFSTNNFDFQMEPLIGGRNCYIWDNAARESTIKAYNKPDLAPPSEQCQCDDTGKKETTSCIVKALSTTPFTDPEGLGREVIGCAARRSCQSEEITQTCKNWKMADIWGC